MLQKKLNLLLIAPMICKSDVGEAWVGFKWAEELNNYFNLTILTIKKKENKSITDSIPGAEIISWEDNSFFQHFERFNSMLKPWYPKFYINSKNWIKQQLRDNKKFHLALQVTPMNIRYPSPLSNFDIPYAVGPVGGSLPNLSGFESEMAKVPWFTKLRSIDNLRLNYDPFLRKSFRNAKAVITTSPHLKSILNPLNSNNIYIINEHGTDHIFKRKKRSNDIIRLLYVGRVIRTKGLRDLIRAMQFLDDFDNVILDVVGSGEDLIECQDEALKLGVKDKIIFHGKLSREEVNKFYENADVFVFPSFREPSGGVIIEAMSYGLPQIVADYGGPSSIVTDKTGIRIIPTNIESYPSDIAKAIIKLVNSEKIRNEMSTASYQEIKDNFFWKEKMAHVASMLESIIE